MHCYYVVSDELYHHGILGMKWGVRRYQNADGSLTEEGKKRRSDLKDEKWDRSIPLSKNAKQNIQLRRSDTPWMTNLIARHNDAIRENVSKFASYTIIDPKEHGIGELEMFEESKDSVNFVWLDIKTSERGNGYAQAAMQSAIEYAKNKGYSQITLEVPGHSPDARHIYEKMGFVEVGVLTTPEEDPYWEGLTKMKKHL